MADIRGDSYGSESEVLAFTRHLLDGETAFNSTTRPTETELVKFIDRASGHMNLALENYGFSTPVTNTTAKLTLDDWVVERAAELVEMTQRGVGFNDPEGSRVSIFRRLHSDARDFVLENMYGFKALGLTVSIKSSDGLAFTGMDAQKDRLDPDDTSLQQPQFHRRIFGYDDPYGSGEED